MSAQPQVPSQTSNTIRVHSRHALGVLCGIGAGVWLGAAEAPTKLVNTGLSPYAISLCMVAGVFTARWSLPTLLKGTRSVFRDLGCNRQLIPFAILAGMLWAVANTLTVFAIRDVGLAIAFPLWNTNSLIGLLWGRLLFGELKGASAANTIKVVLGTVAIVAAAIMLGFSTMHGGNVHPTHAFNGILAALGASLLWGSMYIPYRKAYLSGMNPLSFVTIFTIGELITMFALVLAFDGGLHAAVFHSSVVTPMLFWLFLGGFVWVVGDLFQQYATKYLGIGRGIPLSNTNQLWGLAWGALVFGELAHADATHRLLVVGGSLAMIFGAMAVSTAVATERESASTHEAIERECARYGLAREDVIHAYNGTGSQGRREWWDWLILACAAGVFIALAMKAGVPALAMHYGWTVALTLTLVVSAVVCGFGLSRRHGTPRSSDQDVKNT
ncbi:GRP family sugar transporter [Occallatibacter riparius]|uniref:GRP family sugar transporter n=1 Tax=Occallatibacter riparius TaxID=1002689 RepID=A0A9J7BSZ3_9BACT|nr:GRP family sugar transporter [Occallatibacter riparius]UWZ85705.1 GRP family sugar transporter [Occallatibacter riparius]